MRFVYTGSGHVDVVCVFRHTLVILKLDALVAHSPTVDDTSAIEMISPDVLYSIQSSPNLAGTCEPTSMVSISSPMRAPSSTPRSWALSNAEYILGAEPRLHWTHL